MAFISSLWHQSHTCIITPQRPGKTQNYSKYLTDSITASFFLVSKFLMKYSRIFPLHIIIHYKRVPSWMDDRDNIFTGNAAPSENLHCCASEQEVCSEGLCSAETATHYCTHPCSGWREDKKKKGYISLFHERVKVLRHLTCHTYYTHIGERGCNRANPAFTLGWCFWVGPLEGEFLLPCEAAFTAPCLLLCYK